MKKNLRNSIPTPVWLRHLIPYLYRVGLYSVGAAAVLLIIVAVNGELFSIEGLFLILYVPAFIRT